MFSYDSCSMAAWTWSENIATNNFEVWNNINIYIYIETCELFVLSTVLFVFVFIMIT